MYTELDQKSDSLAPTKHALTSWKAKTYTWDSLWGFKQTWERVHWQVTDETAGGGVAKYLSHLVLGSWKYDCLFTFICILFSHCVLCCKTCFGITAFL